MARLNISLSNELARRITSESEKLGKTISSLITEATAHYIEMREDGIDVNELQDFLTYSHIVSATRSVPVPFKLFEGIVAVAMEETEDDPGKLFYETGRVVGSLIRNYALDMESLTRLCEKLKSELPLDDIRIRRVSDQWEAVISGAGYGKSASQCLASGLKGFLESYDVEIMSIDVMAGFVKATFQ